MDRIHTDREREREGALCILFIGTQSSGIIPHSNLLFSITIKRRERKGAWRRKAIELIQPVLLTGCGRKQLLPCAWKLGFRSIKFSILLLGSETSEERVERRGRQIPYENINNLGRRPWMTPLGDDKKDAYKRFNKKLKYSNDRDKAKS